MALLTNNSHGSLLLSIFGSLYKKKEGNIRRKKLKIYLLVRKEHRDAQKIAKDWLRKFENTKIEI
jgi:hypothetical protein